MNKIIPKILPFDENNIDSPISTFGPSLPQFNGSGMADWYLSEPQANHWNAEIDTNFWAERGGQEAEYRVYALEGGGESKFKLTAKWGAMARPELARV
jgi:hypothetical protein